MNHDDMAEIKQAVSEQLLRETKLRKMFEKLTKTGEDLTMSFSRFLSENAGPLLLTSEVYRTVGGTRRVRFTQIAAPPFLQHDTRNGVSRVQSEGRTNVNCL